MLSLICPWYCSHRATETGAACLSCHLKLPMCPGFGQDGVNFHRTPGRGTARGLGLTPPAQTETDIPYRCRHSGFCWGVSAAGTLSHLGSLRRRCGPRERVCFCRVFSLSVSFLFLFPSVCCSVKLHLSRTTGFCLFIFILLRTPAGGGAVTWRFCCWPQPNHNTRQTWCPTGHFLPTCFPAGQYRTLQFLQFMRFPSAHFSNLRFSE